VKAPAQEGDFVTLQAFEPKDGGFIPLLYKRSGREMLREIRRTAAQGPLADTVKTGAQAPFKAKEVQQDQARRSSIARKESV